MRQKCLSYLRQCCLSALIQPMPLLLLLLFMRLHRWRNDWQRVLSFLSWDKQTHLSFYHHCKHFRCPKNDCNKHIKKYKIHVSFATFTMCCCSSRCCCCCRHRVEWVISFTTALLLSLQREYFALPLLFPYLFGVSLNAMLRGCLPAALSA